MDVSLVIKATAILSAGLLAVRMADHARASVHHLILAATFAALAALPLAAAFVAPTVVLTVTAPSPETLPAERAVNAVRALTAEGAGLLGRSLPAGLEKQDPAYVRRVGSAIARGIWVTGVAVLLASLAVAFFQLRRIRRRGLPWVEGAEITRRLALNAGIQRRVDVLLDERVAAPLTCGVFHPAVVLPADVSSWDHEEIRRALIHELEHVRRFDWATHVLGRIVCAIYWFHPLVWVAWRQLSVSSERACDDAVVAGAGREDYASQLLEVARRLSSAGEQPALAMASRSDLSVRIRAVLDAAQARGRARRREMAATVAATVLVIGTLTSVTADLAPQQGRSATPSSRATGPFVESLITAADSGRIDWVLDLLDRGADVNGVLSGDGSPLIAAARAGHPALARLLLERGADPDLAVSGDGNPLIMAAREGHLEIVQMLLDRGADVNRIVPGDENALIQASWQGHLDVVQFLVGRGADVNARVWSGREWRTARGMAWLDGHDDVVRFLESAGARE